MIKKTICIYIIGIFISILLSTINNNRIFSQNETDHTSFLGQDQNTIIVTEQSKFNPVPFNEIPTVIINSQMNNYHFGADYSLDFGDSTVIEHDNNALSVDNMSIDRKDNTLSLELQCGPTDRCGLSLAPENVRIYLTHISTPDSHIAQNSIPTLELAGNACNDISIEDCANFLFSIPENIVLQEYKIVVRMYFDESEWIFINPVEIKDSMHTSNKTII